MGIGRGIFISQRSGVFALLALGRAGALPCPIARSASASRLKNTSLTFLRDDGYRLQSRTLPTVCSEYVLPLVRKYCSVPIEGIPNIKGDGEIRGQATVDKSIVNPDLGSEVHQANNTTSALKKEFEVLQANSTISAQRKEEKEGPEKVHETKANVLVPWASQEIHYQGKKLPGKAFQPCLLQVVLDTPGNDLRTVLDKWVEDGNCLEGNEARLVYDHLRMHGKRRKTFQYVEWIGKRELLKFEEHDYVSHLLAVANYRGGKAAQDYFEQIPKPFRNGVLYEALLAMYVHSANVTKAKKVFKEIGNLSSPLTVSACNQMLLLYKKVAHKRVVHKNVADIVMLMEKRNVKPSPLTYRLLIDLKVQSTDTSGLESVLDMMKANGVEPNIDTQTMVAKFYISRGLTEKAEEAIRALEVYINDKRCAIRTLLDLYAIIGRPDDVARIWKSCTEPKLNEYLAAIEAWGKLGCIEEVEKTFESLLKAFPKIATKYVNAMLNVYAENKLLSRAKEFLERVCSSGCPSDPLIWDAIVNFYVNSGEVEKADSFLLKVAEENPGRYPLIFSYINLLKAYAKKGDIDNAEKILDMLKKRYPRRTRLCPMETYVNAKAPGHRVIDGETKTMMELLNRLNNLEKGSGQKITE